MTEREAGPEGEGGGGGGVFGRETETETETERERLFTRPNENHHTQCFIHFSVLLSFLSYRIMLYYIILYKTTGILYTWSDGKEGGREGFVYMYACR